MKITDVLTPAMTECNLQGGSKKRVLENLSIFITEQLGGDAEQTDTLFHSLVARERLGSTGIGDGIAIPHCRLDGCDSIIGGLFTVQEPIDFHAFDKMPVKVLFVLLVPTDEVKEHLEVLAMLAQRFESQDYRNSLIAAKQNDDLYRMATIEPTTDIQQQQG